MTAPAPSPAEQAVIDRFGIFEPEARVVEEVARALADAEDAHGPFYFPCLCGWEAGFGAGWEDRGDRHRLLSLAAAAVAAYRAAQDGDLHTRMADVADNLDYYAGKTDGGTHAGGLTDAAGQIRDALTAAQDGGAEEAVRRVEALAAEYERTPPGTVTRDRDVALDLRAALAPQASR